MAWITPNTDVYLLKSVPLDNEHKHTLYFENAEQQYNTFYSFLDRAFTAQTYQRVNKNRLRIEENAETIQGDNYLMFRNAAYGQKWFYAFIDKINYINDKVSEIEYTIDDLQTWYFDYDWEQCFVQREHTLSDKIGENIVNEGLQGGDVIARSGSTDNLTMQSTFMLGGIITNKPLPDRLYNSENLSYIKIKRFSNNDKSMSMAGVASTLYYYIGFMLSYKDYYRESPNLSEYSIQDYVIYDHNSTTPPYPVSAEYFGGLGEVVNRIISGGNSEISENNIIHVFQYPAHYNKKEFENKANNNGYDSGVGYQQITMNLYKTFAYDGTTYVPSNNKMFCYPYNFIRISDHNGAVADFNVEDFHKVKDEPVITFDKISAISGTPTEFIYPVHYKNVPRNYDYGLYTKGYPQPAYRGDSYQSYMQQNMSANVINATTGLIAGGTQIALGALVTKSPYLVATGATSIFSTFTAMGAGMEKARSTQPNTYGNVGGNYISAALQRTGFVAYQMQIKPEMAKIIDKYFSMYGYAVNEVKVPNIALPKNKLRPVWNYIKTTNAYVRGKTTGVPADALRNIEEIHNNGITYWMDSTKMGDYNYVNSPRE